MAGTRRFQGQGLDRVVKRLLALPALVLVSATLTACGSDDSDSPQATDPATMTTGNSGTTGRYGSAEGKEMTPDKKAPQSAGDKREKAPDDVISDRPGSAAKPISP